MRTQQNPKIPEHINTTKEHPLKDFSILLVGLTVVLVVSVFLLSLLVERFAAHIPFQWEQRITQSYEQLFTNDDVAKDTLTEYQQAFIAAEKAIAALGESLAQESQLPTDMTLTFHLMENDAPNAFATLGGHVFVTTGLLNTVSSENALAMVVAHEIAHVKFRHPVTALSRGALFQLIFSAVFGSADAASLQSVLGNTGMVTMLQFNRDMERVSDEHALKVLLSYYGHVGGAGEFFMTMLDQVDSVAWQEVFQTHPGVESRIEKIRAANTGTNDSPPVLNPLDTRLIKLKALIVDSPL